MKYVNKILNYYKIIQKSHNTVLCRLFLYINYNTNIK